MSDPARRGVYDLGGLPAMEDPTHREPTDGLVLVRILEEYLDELAAAMAGLAFVEQVAASTELMRRPRASKVGFPDPGAPPVKIGPIHCPATVSWSRGDAPFLDRRYSRAHVWRFDGGIEVPASASPHVVPLPLSSAKAVDPEEAFVAALSSCHMLTFLGLAAADGWVVDRYDDDAVGTLAPEAGGRRSMTEVVLRPQITFAGRAPDDAALHDLHERAHAECFIARSVKTEVRVATP